MKRLPSGTLAGITHVRARYHAARKRLRVFADTPASALYPLIDIVVKPAEAPSTGADESLRFTGHTLADLAHLPAWSEPDRREFQAWLRQDEQIREINLAKRRILADDRPRRVRAYPYPQRLYSSLARRIAVSPQASAPPKQWIGILRNLKGEGVREDELLWSGIQERLVTLDRQAAPGLTREAVAAEVDFSRIRLEVTNELVDDGDCLLNFSEIAEPLGKYELRDAGLPLPGDGLAVARYCNATHGYRVGVMKERGSVVPRWFVLDPEYTAVTDGDGRELFDSRQRALDAANRHARDHLGLSGDYAPCRRYEHKTLCGGTDYREWLVSLPDFPQSFFGSHYYARNVLLHLRTKTRFDRQGRRLLFIEELQSDWHQQGAMLGYENRWPGLLPLAPFRREWPGLAVKLMLMHAVDAGFDALAWTNGREQEMQYFREMPPVRRIYDKEIPRYLERLAAPWGVKAQTTVIATKEPRLHARRVEDKWQVVDAEGYFRTRSRYTRQEAMDLIARHCRSIDLEVHMFAIPAGMRAHIREQGLPLFGEALGLNCE